MNILETLTMYDNARFDPDCSPEAFRAHSASIKAWAATDKDSPEAGELHRIAAKLHMNLYYQVIGEHKRISYRHTSEAAKSIVLPPLVPLIPHTDWHRSNRAASYRNGSDD